MATTFSHIITSKLHECMQLLLSRAPPPPPVNASTRLFHYALWLEDIVFTGSEQQQQEYTLDSSSLVCPCASHIGDEAIFYECKGKSPACRTTIQLGKLIRNVLSDAGVAFVRIGFCKKNANMYDVECLCTFKQRLNVNHRYYVSILPQYNVRRVSPCERCKCLSYSFNDTFMYILDVNDENKQMANMLCYECIQYIKYNRCCQKTADPMTVYYNIPKDIGRCFSHEFCNYN